MKKALGAALAILLAAAAWGQDREKKTYELLYEDVQLLKVQMQRLEKKLNQTAEDVLGIKNQVRDALSRLEKLQSDQAKTQEGLRTIPAQFQVLIDKLTQVDALLTRVADDLSAFKARPTEEAEAPDKDKSEKNPAVKKPQEKEPGAKEERSTPPVTNLSPQELFSTAMADYEKGNFDLAADGFSLYRESFPASPLADNALYMIGECAFSQKKLAKAIDAFDDLIMSYPQSDKIAAAYFKKGLSLIDLKKRDEAVAVLRFLVAKYPVEEEAKQAQAKLKELLERQ